MFSHVVSRETFSSVSILTHVKPIDVYDHWPRVEAGLQRICKRHTPDWIPPDIYRALLNDTAWLVLVGGDGFLVVEKYPGANGRGVLFVVACEGTDMQKNYDDAMVELVELAKKLGCKRIRHISPRKGWAAKFWRSVGYVYEREV